ncbi:histidine kinase [Clostridium sp. W14A]|nr:histidine kinase [Clostridium sp. W14A]
MKRKKFKYLSSRVTWLIAACAACFLLYLAAWTAVAVREERHMALVLAGFFLFAAAAAVFWRWIRRPYLENSRALRLFSTGYTMNGLFSQRTALSPEIEDAVRKIQEIMNTDKLISATKKQAQYLALQNQINPHFLYNALEGIRGETLSAGLESVAKMTEALSTFFRYTISGSENLVTLEDELANIRNYYIIQRYRFGEKLNLSVEYDADHESEIMSYCLPKLTLQPIVENAIYHGIERIIGKGRLRIKIEVTARRLIITVSDNGIGMTEERLREINSRLGDMTLDYINPEKESHGGIAVVNVNNRIKLLFGEEYGICMYSTQNVGTDVEITLPLIQKDGRGTYEK